MLHFDDLSLRRGAKVLFEGASFQIHPGQRAGITGANGSGKSSLFALVQGELQSDTGHFSLPDDWVIAHVAQEAPGGTQTALDYTLDGDKQLREIERQLGQAEREGQGERQATLLAQLEAIDGYSAKSRAAQLLHGLGFQNHDLERSLDEFSGGWRVRLNLAQALMCRSDLLLLDEPTNHLDLDAVLWLEQWLKSYTGTLLMVSHDRDFLDSISTCIVNIEREQAQLYSGNYSAFERLRAERLAGQQAAFKKQQREIAHMRAFVDRFRAKATKARQAQSRLKALERMDEILPAHVDSPFVFRLREVEDLPAPLLTLRDADVGYGDITVVRDIELSLAPGDRVGLLGPNGAGKSTFIKLLAGTLPLKAGDRTAAKMLSVGYFAQHQVDQLHPPSTPLEHLVRLDPQAREQELRNYLGSFGFSNDQAVSPVAPFSGGEKSRLALALLVYQRPNLLLLDEPTNHLDLEMRQALANALQDFPGAMVIVSHDRHLLRLTVDQLLLVDDGRAAEFQGALDDYPDWIIERQKALRSRAKDAVSQPAGASRKEQRRLEAQQRQALAPLRNALKKAETELAELESAKHEIEQALADTTLYDDDRKDELKQVLARQADNSARLADCEERWLAAGEALEAAASQMPQQ